MKAKIYEYQTGESGNGSYFKDSELNDECCYWELEVEIPDWMKPGRNAIEDILVTFDGANYWITDLFLKNTSVPTIANPKYPDKLYALKVLSRTEKSSTRTL